MKVLEEKVIQLPPTSDQDGHKVEIEIFLTPDRRLPDFIFSERKGQLTFIPDVGDDGVYSLTIRLRDIVELSMYSYYHMTVVVYKKEEIEVNDQEKLWKSLSSSPLPVNNNFQMRVSYTNEKGIARIKFSMPIMPYITEELLQDEELNIISVNYLNETGYDNDQLLSWDVLKIEDTFIDLQLDYSDPKSVSIL